MRLSPILVFALLGAGAHAAAHAGGDPAEGAKLVAKSGCDGCHAGLVPGGPSAFYTRKDRKVHSLSKLRGQVSRCSTQLNLQLFPEDEENIVAYLNQAYYKFPADKK